MSEVTKYGAFGGVFTPSILTILGVIMYMRLPWIVGHAGMWLTIGIILVAHIVSICTGLSISSIATDKKVKGGGSYYIISRSLGLPIGGMLGIALFVGLSLSVSLYLIGFSESFLGFWGIPITKNLIRLVGTLAIISVGTLTFISTSLAIKTQFFIMGAIILSLVTIVFGKTDFIPQAPLLYPGSNMPPLIMLFAVFFPAVTGFEAGVSMSGDLKDPQKDIPVGTITAILLGLVVYIALTVFLAYRVDADQLINNPNILIELSAFAPLLVAGVWGATLSSAIGSILGAPRILQATSLDRITPHIFAKGYGPTKEPRNALMLTFLIAEAGILIGELNLIARIVAIFFITAYGFLNLSNSIEKWASPDFRPRFKIPDFVSIVGAIVCFILMLQLDFVAFIVGTIIMSSIFLYLKRKELTLESGDTWEGVWSSLLRTGLNKLNATQRHTRNWRPNIILFSGHGKQRHYLLEFGSWLVHNRGILSNFDLIENPKVKQLKPRSEGSTEPIESEFKGVFARQMEVNDLYDGMETITKVYGFAGIEPNTLLLGWPKNEAKVKRFVRLLAEIADMNHNLMILNYDFQRGFGKKRRIDFWWRGSSANFTFALTVVKFLQNSSAWDKSEFNLFVVLDDIHSKNKAHKNISHLLNEQRIPAHLKIISNTIEQQSIYDLIKLQSHDADLVILGLPDFKKELSPHYISATQNLLKSLGSTLHLQASSFFKPVLIGLEHREHSLEESSIKTAITRKLKYPEKEYLQPILENIYPRLKEALKTYHSEVLLLKLNTSQRLTQDFKQLIQRGFTELQTIFDTQEKHRALKILMRVQSKSTHQALKLIEEYPTQISADYHLALLGSLEALFSSFEEISADIPEKNTEHIPLRLWLNTAIAQIKKQASLKYLKNISLYNYQYLSDIQRLAHQIIDANRRLHLKHSHEELRAEDLNHEQDLLLSQIAQLTSKSQDAFQEAEKILMSDLAETLNTLSSDLDLKSFSRAEIKQKNLEYKLIKSETQDLLALPEAIKNNLLLLLNFFKADLLVQKFQDRLETVLDKSTLDFIRTIESSVLNKMPIFLNTLKKPENIDLSELNWDIESATTTSEQHIVMGHLLKGLHLALEDLPEQMHFISEESFQDLEQHPTEAKTSFDLDLRKRLRYLGEQDLLEPLQDAIKILSSEIEKTVDSCGESVRLLNYHLTHDSDEEQQGSVEELIKSTHLRLQQEYQGLLSQKSNFEHKLTEIKSNFAEKLNIYLLLKNAEDLKTQMRAREHNKIIKHMLRAKEYLYTKGNDALIKLIHRQSQGSILAQKWQQDKTQYQTPMGQMLDAITQISPNPEVIEHLPYYYKQLFGNSRRLYQSHFLIQRPHEKAKIEQALKLYNLNRSGALLVLGEPHSGKSTLSWKIAHQFTQAKNIFDITAPEGHEASIKLLHQEIAKVLYGQNATVDTVFKNMPSQSVVIFHNLECWWTRNTDGIKIIHEIMQIVQTYAQRCLFIINMNASSYSLINQISNLESYFTYALETSPFDSAEIQKSVLSRHRPSGLEFIFGKKHESEISQIKLARLFQHYFNVSQGNIGLAFQFWLANITRIAHEKISIRTPLKMAPLALDVLEPEHWIILQALVLHQQISRKRLNQVLAFEPDQSQQWVDNLLDYGLLLINHHNVLKISPFTQVEVLQGLQKKELL